MAGAPKETAVLLAMGVVVVIAAVDSVDAIITQPTSEGSVQIFLLWRIMPRQQRFIPPTWYLQSRPPHSPQVPAQQMSSSRMPSAQSEDDDDDDATSPMTSSCTRETSASATPSTPSLRPLVAGA